MHIEIGDTLSDCAAFAQLGDAFRSQGQPLRQDRVRMLPEHGRWMPKAHGRFSKLDGEPLHRNRSSFGMDHIENLPPVGKVWIADELGNGGHLR